MSMRCGLIVSEERAFLRPLGKILDIVSPLTAFASSAKPGTILKNLDLPDAIEIDDLANSILYMHLYDKILEKEIYKKNDMEMLSQKFKQMH